MKLLKGLSIIELLTAVSVLAVLLTAGYQVFRTAARTADLAQDYAQAQVMARDLLEITISKRNEDWNSISAGVYHFDVVSDEYVFDNGPEVVDQFTRSLTISTVNRDASGNIVSSGGTLDVDVYKLTSDVSWEFRDQTYDVVLEQYITNWRRF